MKKNLLRAIGLTFAVVSLTANAEVLTMGQTEPSQGIVKSFGALRIYNKGVPVPNPECKTPAMLYLDDTLLDAIESTSSRVQRFIMQADVCFTLNFTSHPYTTPGTYRVTVPEGFVTYNDGADINAAATYEFKVNAPVQIVSDPPTGFVEDMPRHITVTFPGVKEVIDNHTPQQPGSQFDRAIRFDNPEGFCYPEITIEGNVLHMYFGANLENDQENSENEDIAYRAKVVTPDEEYMTWIGEYSLNFFDGNLTFIMPDGSEQNNFATTLLWVNPQVPVPTASPMPGKVDQISDFSITLQNDGVFGMWNPIENAPTVYAVDQWGLEKKVAKFIVVNNGKDKNEATFTLNSPIVDAGTYIVRIKKSSFSVQSTDFSGWISCNYDYTYEVSGSLTGVQGIFEAEGRADVYTASGILVGRDMDPESVKALPAGLYIVNGKKIVIR